MGTLLSTPSPNPSDTRTTTATATSSPPKPTSQKNQKPPISQTLEEKPTSDPQMGDPKRDLEEEPNSGKDPIKTLRDEESINLEKPKEPLGENPEKDEEGEGSGDVAKGEEEEEEGECGFCLFMKGGGCKESFVAWEDCIEEAEKNKEDIVEKCFEVTGALKKCMEAHSEYYAPILQAEKAAEAEAIREIEKEKEKEKGEAAEQVLKKD